MKRSGMPQRTSELRRTGFARKPAVAVKPRRRKDTGPTVKTRHLVHLRSGDMCEWPGCWLARSDVHHRLDRGMGGRGGVMRTRLNQAGWLVDACRMHHGVVTDAVGEALVLAREMGWVLPESRGGVPVDAEVEPILTRHASGLVLLGNAGGWRSAT